MAKKFDNDEGGVSLLNKRLSGEKLDNNVIDELMVKEEENTEKKSFGSKFFKKKKDNTTDTIAEDTTAQEVTYYENDYSSDNVTKTNPDPNTVSSNISQPTVNQNNNISSDINKSQQSNNLNMSVAENGINDEEDEILNNVINNTYSIMRNDNQKTPINNPIQKPTVQQVVPNNIQQVPVIAPNMVYSGQYQQPNAYTVPTNEYSNVPIMMTPVIQQPIQPVTEHNSLTQEEKKYIEQVSQRRKKRSATRIATKLITKLLVWAMYIGIIVGFSWLIFTYFLGITKMNGDSMSPTYYNKETLIVDKITVNLNKVGIDDIIIFNKDDNRYVARVIAKQGDKITIDENDNIYINNVLYRFQNKENENFFNEKEDDVIENIPNIKKEYNLGVNEFFVHNDNEEIILDSRLDNISIITKNEIYGVVLAGFNFNK